MATLQSALTVDYLIDATLNAWSKLIKSVDIRYIGPILNQISLVLIQNYNVYTITQICKVGEIMEWLICNHEHHLFDHLLSVCLFPETKSVQAFAKVNHVIRRYQSKMTVEGRIGKLLDAGIIHTNALVVLNSLGQLQGILRTNSDFIQGLAMNEAPIVSRMVNVLLSTCFRFDNSESEIQLLSCECLGSIGIRFGSYLY
jgi:serine/threonine-protein kinase ATR